MNAAIITMLRNLGVEESSILLDDFGAAEPRRRR
jgi:Na+-transporting NADH:ubiquinone oxidoreductase subunit NqrF